MRRIDDYKYTVLYIKLFTGKEKAKKDYTNRKCKNVLMNKLVACVTNMSCTGRG